MDGTCPTFPYPPDSQLLWDVNNPISAVKGEISVKKMY